MRTSRRSQPAVDIGPSAVDGMTCEQYAFRQEGVDWQIWIQLGDFPLPRKLVIRTLTDDAKPQHSENPHLESGALLQRERLHLRSTGRRSPHHHRTCQAPAGGRNKETYEAIRFNFRPLRHRHSVVWIDALRPTSGGGGGNFRSSAQTNVNRNTNDQSNMNVNRQYERQREPQCESSTLITNNYYHGGGYYGGGCCYHPVAVAAAVTATAVVTAAVVGSIVHSVPPSCYIGRRQWIGLSAVRQHLVPASVLGNETTYIVVNPPR